MDNHDEKEECDLAMLAGLAVEDSNLSDHEIILKKTGVRFFLHSTSETIH